MLSTFRDRSPSHSLSLVTQSQESDLKQRLIGDEYKDMDDDLEEQSLQKKKVFFGYMLMMIFVLSNSMADSSSKILFLAHTDLGVLEMLFVRAFIVIFFFTFLIRNKMKYILYDSVPRNMIAPLLVRCLSGFLGFYCINSAIKYLPIVIVALFTNTMPIFTSLLGFIILKEKITKWEIFCLFLAFYGVYVLLQADVQTEGEQSNIAAWPLFLCIAGPVLMATTNICLRHMRGLHEYTISTYSVLFSLTMYGLMILLTGQSLTIPHQFNGYEYLILIFVSLAGGFGMIFKTKAFQYEMAGRLGMLCYLSIVFTFLFDQLLIGTHFSKGEIKGMIIIFAANLISGFVVFRRNFFKNDKIQ